MALADDGYAAWSDAALIDATRDGDADAFAELFRRHQHGTATAARRVLGNSYDADDAVSDAWSRVYRLLQRGGVIDSDNFGAYVRRAARNAALDMVKARRRLTSFDAQRPTYDGGSVTPIERALEREEASNVVNAFGQLPDRWKHVLWDLDVEGRTISDVATELDLTANGVSQLRHRAVTGLRAAYSAVDPGAALPKPNTGSKKLTRLAAATALALSTALLAPISSVTNGTVPYASPSLPRPPGVAPNAPSSASAFGAATTQSASASAGWRGNDISVWPRSVTHSSTTELQEIAASPTPPPKPSDPVLQLDAVVDTPLTTIGVHAGAGDGSCTDAGVGGTAHCPPPSKPAVDTPVASVDVRVNPDAVRPEDVHLGP